jgi:hypothetical protein
MIHTQETKGIDGKIRAFTKAGELKQREGEERHLRLTMQVKQLRS